MAQKNVLQFVILGLLANEPRTGYELAQAFANEIGEFWQAKHSQIYPQLGKLEEQGLIEHDVAVSGTRLEKKIYRVTASGREYLDAWINQETPDLPVTRDEFVLKLFLIKDAADPRLPVMFREQLRLHTDWLLHLLSRMNELFGDPDERKQNYGHYLVLSRAIERETDYVDWLKSAQINLDDVAK